MNKNLLVIFLVMLSLSMQGAELTFKIPEYAGSTFSFYIVPNFLMGQNTVVSEGTVDESGAFKATLNIEKTSMVYSEFGIYKGWFIAEPGKSYEFLSLPPKKENSSTNPYFRPKLVHIVLKDRAATETDMLVDNFDRVYASELAKNRNEIFYRRSLDAADLMISALSERYPATQNEYFEQHKAYKYAATRHLALIQDPTEVINESFINKPILYGHPEYGNLFETLFLKYLQYSTQQAGGQKTAVMVNSGAYDQLIEWLTVDNGFNKELSEAIIIIGIKSLFYSKKFNSNGIFSILQQIKDNSTVAVHKEVAGKIYSELTRTMYGAMAPELALLNVDGSEVNWEDFSGKYVYVAFTRTDNEKFSYHKDLMKASYLKFKDNLQLLLVLEDDNNDPNSSALKSDGFEWTVCLGSSRPEIYQSYNVRIMPTYFLIDPEGRMAGSQAPWPDENFDLQFSVIVNASK